MILGSRDIDFSVSEGAGLGICSLCSVYLAKTAKYLSSIEQLKSNKFKKKTKNKLQKS